jgi:hypothetical protein
MNFLRTIAPIEDDESGFDSADQGHGKRRSNRKPWQAGFAAQTVVTNLDDIKSYKLFERTIVSRINPRSVVELELTYRLASLFWRLRRASGIEAGLLQLQVEKLAGAKGRPTPRPNILSGVQSRTRLTTIGTSRSSSPAAKETESAVKETKSDESLVPVNSASCQTAGSTGRLTAAECFIRLFHHAPDLLDRAAAHESRLWRQVGQVIWMLDALRHLPPRERRIPRKPNLRPFRRITD